MESLLHRQCATEQAILLPSNWWTELIIIRIQAYFLLRQGDIFFDGENQLVQYFADVFKGFAVASITQMEEVRHIVMRNRAVGLDEAQVTADGRYLQKPVQFNVDDSVHLRILVPQRVRVLTAGEQLLVQKQFQTN